MLDTKAKSSPRYQLKQKLTTRISKRANPASLEGNRIEGEELHLRQRSAIQLLKHLRGIGSLHLD